jgi:hypothetical protein
LEKYRKRESNGVERHLRQGGEAAIIYLLLAADFIQLHHLDPDRICEVCYGRIIEG